jgi:hypothetical protein
MKITPADLRGALVIAFFDAKDIASEARRDPA